jgi:hypothetical protein
MNATFDLDNFAIYEDVYDRDRGFCDNSDAEILSRIEELIKENNNERSSNHELFID